jgi:hypothetical protein
MAIPGVPAPAAAAVVPAKPVVVKPPEVGAARELGIVAWVLTFAFAVPILFIFGTLLSLGVLAFLGFVPCCPVAIPLWLVTIPFVGPWILFLTLVFANALYMMFIGGAALLFLLIFLIAAYVTVAGRIGRGIYERARGAALFFAIILFFTVLPAIFYFLAYGRLGEVVTKYGPIAVLGAVLPGGGAGPFGSDQSLAVGPPPGVVPPMAGGPPVGAGPFPAVPGPAPMGMPHPGQAVTPRVPLCPNCGRELYYSANHRRWYCMNCDQPRR